MTREERREKREADKARDERMVAVRGALADEMDRFRGRLQAGAVAVLNTAFGPFQVDAVNEDFWFTTHPSDQVKTEWNRRSFAGCNDGGWASLLSQVGEARNPLFAEFA